MTRQFALSIVLVWSMFFMYNMRVHNKHEHCVAVVLKEVSRAELLSDREKRELGVKVDYFCNDSDNDIYDTMNVLGI